MSEITAFLGDSEKGAAAYSITSLSLGLALGVLLGELQFPLPGGGQFALGLAGGPLLVGLIVGRAGRTGPHPLVAAARRRRRRCPSSA